MNESVNAIRRDVEKAESFGHTQGSGKSLTMVLLGKALALDKEIENPRIVLVTDRIDLDEQIWKAFHQCGKDPKQAKTGKHLFELLKSEGASVITTIIDKFHAASKSSSKVLFGSDPSLFGKAISTENRNWTLPTRKAPRRIFPCPNRKQGPIRGNGENAS